MSETPAERPPRLGIWTWRLFVTAVLVVIAYSVVGFVVVPTAIRHLVVNRVTRGINGQLRVECITFNPYTFKLTMLGSRILDEDYVVVASLWRLDGNVQAFRTLFRDGYHLREVILDQGAVHGEVDTDGEFNIARVLDKERDFSLLELREIPRIIVDDLQIITADLTFRDETLSSPFEYELTDVSARLDGLDTKPESENPLHLTARSGNGAELAWTGSLSVDPLLSTGSIELTAVRLPAFMPYFRDATEARLVTGRLSVDLEYDFAPLRDPRAASVVLNRLTIDDGRIEREGDAIVEAPTVELTDAHLDIDARNATVDTVTLNGAEFFLRRDEAGELQLVTWSGGSPLDLAPVPSDVDPDTIEYPIEQLLVGVRNLIADAFGNWSIDVERVVFDDATASFSDAAPRRPVELGVTDMRLELGPVSSDDRYRAPVKLRATIDGTGTVEIEGDTQALDRTVDVAVRASGLALAAISPYMPIDLITLLPPVELAAATVDLDGRLQARPAEGGGFDTTWDGTTTLQSVLLSAVDGADRVLAFERARVTGETNALVDVGSIETVVWDGEIELSSLAVAGATADRLGATLDRLTAKGRLDILANEDGGRALKFEGDAEIAAPAVEWAGRELPVLGAGGVVVRGLSFDSAGKRIAIDDLTLDDPSARLRALLLPTQERAVEDAVPDLGWDLAVGHLTMTGGAVTLRDDSGDPPVVVNVDALAVELTNVVNDGRTVAELAASLEMESTGRIEVTGSVDAFREFPYGDLQLTVTSLPLKPYDPLAGPYLGYLIKSGRASMTMPVTLRDGHLEGEITLVLDQMYLGEKVDSPHAPDVPLKLGLDLLRDKNERVEITIPVSGDMNDPDFSLTGVVLDAFLGAITGIVAAPFNLLGSLLGLDEDQDISLVAFVPGSVGLSAEAISTLDLLARALNERPALRLRVVGRYDPAADDAALREAALHVRLFGEGERDVSPSRMRSAVEEAYRDRFGNQQIPQAQKKEALLAEIEIDPSALRSLAQQRAVAAAAVLVNDNGIPATRVQAAVPEGDAAAADQPKVDFELE